MVKIFKISKNEEMKISSKDMHKILSIVPMLFIVIGIILDGPVEVFWGMKRIVLSSSVLISDFVEIGGLGASMVNAGILGLLNLLLLHKLDFKMNGSLLAAYFTVMGFSFFGKNIFNVWPIYLGGLIYSKTQGVSFKNAVLITMFSTGLAPIVSEISFGMGYSIPFGISVGMVAGIIIGLVMPALTGNMLKFHNGYNLYNIGFTAGMLGMVLNAVFKSYGVNIHPEKSIYSGDDTLMLIIFVGLCLLLLAIGIKINNNSIDGYSKIFLYSGRLVTDFTQVIGYGVSFINMGVMGLIAIFYVKAMGGGMNGATIAGVMTIIGFGAFGKHPKNSIPLLLGVYIASLTKIWDVNSTIVIIAGLFSTTLAPIAGVYGSFMGLVAGFLHLSIVMNVGYLHGGINLYNNGFAGGLVAGLMVPVIEEFKRRPEY
ncbi:MAG: DUF1576 domain-containing protein [Firmicutes bacterium]|nr:DUF1576 domain-containing protein [Bacillota bacterium]